MKPGQIANLLECHGRALTAAGADHAGRLVGDLAAAPVATLAALKKALHAASRHSPDLGPASETVETVLPLVSGLRSTLDKAGAKTAVKDLAGLEIALRAVGSFPIAALVAYVEKGAAKSKSAGRGKGGKTVDREVVSTFADRLTSANSDDAAFRRLIEEMKSSKLGKPTIDAITDRFLGRSQPFPSKSIAEAIKKIEERHFLDALSESRAKTIERVNI